jgi:hypothetical protein
MIEVGMIVNGLGVLHIVVQDHRGIRFFELVGMNAYGKWLVI